MTKWLKALGIVALIGCLMWSEAALAFRGGGRGAGFRGGGFHGAGFRAGGVHRGGAWAGRGVGAGRWAGGRYGYGRYGYGALGLTAGAAALATAPYWNGGYNANYNCGAYAYYAAGYGCVPYQQ